MTVRPDSSRPADRTVGSAIALPGDADRRSVRGRRPRSDRRPLRRHAAVLVRQCRRRACRL